MADLRDQARAAYERGRLRAALPAGAIVLTLAVIAVVLGETPMLESGIGLTAAGLAAWMGWRGESPGKGVLPGIVAGAIGFTVPLLARAAGLVSLGCGGTAACIASTAAGGLVAGVLLARLTRADALPTLVWGLGLASIIAAQTCVGLGFAGLIAMVGAAALTAPVLRLAFAR